MTTGLCFYSESGMLTTMQDVLDEAIPIWEKQTSLGMCYAVMHLGEERVFNSNIIIAVLGELMRYTKEISPYHIFLQEALTARYGGEGFDYYYEVFKDWNNRRRPTRWQNLLYRVKRMFS